MTREPSSPPGPHVSNPARQIVKNPTRCDILAPACPWVLPKSAARAGRAGACVNARPRSAGWVSLGVPLDVHQAEALGPVLGFAPQKRETGIVRRVREDEEGSGASLREEGPRELG